MIEKLFPSVLDNQTYENDPTFPPPEGVEPEILDGSPEIQNDEVEGAVIVLLFIAVLAEIVIVQILLSDEQEPLVTIRRYRVVE